jgi:hypothetical protein
MGLYWIIVLGINCDLVKYYYIHVSPLLYETCGLEEVSDFKHRRKTFLLCYDFCFRSI